jgi:16S rRNA processing protein rimM
MISRNEVFEIGQLLKPHGVKGEIGAEVDSNVNLSMLKCVVMDVEGILVPFFIESIRQKSSLVWLVKFCDIDSDSQVSQYTHKTIYALKSDCEELLPEDSDGMYASDFIGYNVLLNDGSLIGTIADVNDDTANTLFVIEAPSGTPLLIPVAQDYILDVIPDQKIMVMDLPTGLIDL